jgi:hypothetical protein
VGCFREVLECGSPFCSLHEVFCAQEAYGGNPMNLSPCLSLSIGNAGPNAGAPRTPIIGTRSDRTWRSVTWTDTVPPHRFQMRSIAQETLNRRRAFGPLAKRQRAAALQNFTEARRALEPRGASWRRRRPARRETMAPRGAAGSGAPRRLAPLRRQVTDATGCATSSKRLARPRGGLCRRSPRARPGLRRDLRRHHYRYSRSAHSTHSESGPWCQG